MDARHTAHIPVRSSDLDAWDDLSAAILSAYLQQTAWEASSAGGFPEAWYRNQGTAWVLHRLTLARLGTLPHGTTAHVTTWVPRFGRVRAQRETEVAGPDGGVVAAASADWAYVDRARGLPCGVDPRFAAQFETGATSAWLAALPVVTPLVAPARHFTMARRAYRYETDGMGHINNTCYPAWLDEALADAVTGAGLPLARPGDSGLRLWGTRYQLNYLRPAQAGEELTIHSTLIGTADSGYTLEWQQEVHRVADATVLLRCRSQQQLRGLEAATLSPSAVLAALTHHMAPLPAG